LTDIKVW